MRGVNAVLMRRQACKPACIGLPTGTCICMHRCWPQQRCRHCVLTQFLIVWCSDHGASAGSSGPDDVRGGTVRGVLLRHTHHALAAGVWRAVLAHPHAAGVSSEPAGPQQPPRQLRPRHGGTPHRLPPLLQQRHRRVEPGVLSNPEAHALEP